jgi:glycerol-3-phosphate dehydrogenase
MRIFILGAGATGSLLAQLLERQGHTVWCGDRDPERARRFLGRRSTIPVTEVNARNLRGIVKAAKPCQLLVNASASVFNEIVLRAALRQLSSDEAPLQSRAVPLHQEVSRKEARGFNQCRSGTGIDEPAREARCRHGR